MLSRWKGGFLGAKEVQLEFKRYQHRGGSEMLSFSISCIKGWTVHGTLSDSGVWIRPYLF